MLTYLALNVHKWKRRPVLFMMIFFFPILLFSALYPFLKSSANDLAVPIALVDKDQSEWSELVRTRVEEDERVRVILMEEGEASRSAVQKGDVEAAFIFQEEFEESVRNGNLTNTIQWIRTERSTLDVFVKELIGAEMMRLALNAKAANTLQNWGEDVGWEAAFTHAGTYWDPKPLFQMEYQSTSPDQSERSAPRMASWKLVIMAMFFLYAWLWFLSLLNGISIDEKEGRLERVLFLRGSRLKYDVMHFLIFFVISGVVYFLSLNWMFQITQTDVTFVKAWNMWSAVVWGITMLLSNLLFLIARRKSGILLAIMLFAFISFVVQVLPLQNVDVWTGFFPHHWLTEFNPWEAGRL